MTQHVNRRGFLGSALATGAFTIVPRHVLGGEGYVSPSDKITLAQIGMGTQGFNELGDLLAEPQIQIVAVCDPNRDSHDYVEWSKNSVRDRIRGYLDNPSWREGRGGCPGGRDVGREVVNTYYANRRAAENFRGCAAYADFRELLDREQDLDAVKVMTPDHLHATVSVAALNKGQHVLMHKPIANRMYEGRLVLDTVRRTNKATHLLAYGSGTGNGWIAQQIKQGVIGPLREIHNWTNRPVWPQYTEIPRERPPVPDGFEWDLWLGPATDRPYHPHYTHTVFRGWYDFGGGSMADMGIYSLWPVFTALELETPQSAEALSTHACSIVDHVSRVTHNDFSYPAASTQRFQFAAGQNHPELDLFWYDGGMRPRVPRELETQGIELDREGILFVGDEGIVLAGFGGQNPALFVNGQRQSFAIEEQRLSRESTAGKPHSDWLAACRGGDPSPGSFLQASAITDAVNLGTVALRAGQKVTFDSDGMKITNAPDANRYLFREYRSGWAL